MYKLIMIDTHGITITEGTPIHCYAAVASNEGNYSFAFVYDSVGKLEKAYKAKYNPVEELFYQS